MLGICFNENAKNLLFQLCGEYTGKPFWEGGKGVATLHFLGSTPKFWDEFHFLLASVRVS